MKQFKAESKKLMDMVINSIYTNKDIFLRELISNASDAIDKRRFLSLTDSSLAADFCIRLSADKDARTLTIEDNGVGMTKDELESNLGTIAASGTQRFKAEQQPDENLIGQFGVGFYSAFMVAKKVEVISRAVSAESAYRWTSSGADGYDVKPCGKADIGTQITLWIKDDDEDCAYGDYLKEYKLRGLVKTYSDYIRYPVVMNVSKSKKNDEGEGYTEYSEEETLNSMIPIWKKPKNSVKKEEYAAFYSAQFHDFHAPAETISVNIEGSVNYTALLFIPEKLPVNYYSKDYKKGLALYCNGVMIQEKCEQLLPDWLGFVRGIVDSPDLSLNVSREILQESRQLRFIANSLRKKIIDHFKKWLKKDRAAYEKFYTELGEGINYGVYENFGANKDELKDLVMLYSSTEKKPVLLSEYTSRMKPDQAGIYYAGGESVAKADALPQLEMLKEQGVEILYCTRPVDEFCLLALGEYDKHKFVNALDGGGEEKDETKAEEEAEEKLLEAVKTALGGKVGKVKLSSRLKSHAACLTTGTGMSPEMERVLRASGEQLFSERVLELNAAHPLYARLKAAQDSDNAAFDKIATVLYGEAALMAIGELDDAAGFVTALNELLEK